jgi:hypothetical protein
VDLELVDFDEPSETRQFKKGRFELYRVGPVTVGRATYEPGGDGRSTSRRPSARLLAR